MPANSFPLSVIPCMAIYPVSGSNEVVSGNDNRDIVDDGASQELTEENIAEMKDQGASGKVPIPLPPLTLSLVTVIVICSCFIGNC